MSRSFLIAVFLGITVTACTSGQERLDTAGPTETATTILEMMVVTITPASDTLWGVDDPQTDEEWQVLDDAALAVIETFGKIRKGGGGPNDAMWASEDKFQAYIDEEIAAGEAARVAITARDLDALFAAGDILYPPCENCHIDFNPGVTEEQY